MMSGATDAQCNQALAGFQSSGLCGGDGGPSSGTCPTKAQSVTYSAKGSCSASMGGMITISTQPWLCSLVVKGGEAVGLPSHGQFSGAASHTLYDITKGNWALSLSEGDAGEGSSNVLCDAAARSGGISLSCSGTTCPPSGSCSNTVCAEQLTPTP
jgi:hypothetical protein